MEFIRQRAYARAGLVGNPSDGYHGRTLSVIVRNFFAEVILYEWEDLEIILSQEDRNRFHSIHELHRDVKQHGYYGGVRLVKAAIRRFADFCRTEQIELHDRNFSVRYESNIPRAVGLAGSSAIITATLRALMKFYQVDIPNDVLASLALSVETLELGITGGLQDRVIQAYEGLVFMDFTQEHERFVGGMACGRYEELDPALLPPLYIAYSADAGEPTEVLHAPLRARYEKGDPEVRAAMLRFAELTTLARVALEAGDHAAFSHLMDQNFDLRATICNLSPAHVQMIKTARSAGVSAKYAGSGGCIVGVCPDDSTFERLRERMQAINCSVVRPIVQAGNKS